MIPQIIPKNVSYARKKPPEPPKVWGFFRFFFFTYFVSYNGLCEPKKKWHRKEHIIVAQKRAYYYC